MNTKRNLALILILPAILISACNQSSAPSSTDKGTSSSSSKEDVISSTTSNESISSSSESINSSSSSAKSFPTYSEEEPDAKYFRKDVTVKMDGGLVSGENQKVYDLPFIYSDSFFIESAKQYSEGLSMISFAASLATADKTRGDAFYSETGFSDIASYGYDSEPTKESMGYYIAHKTINDFELITVSFRGFNYGMEWANNFLIGKIGNHAGFDARGLEAFANLQTYIKKYCENKSLKVWINGYSRGGALSNILASYIMRTSSIPVSQDNLFVYTFEAPASLGQDNAIAYENVHNIRNNADLITYIPPETYGLGRCGVDYPIYDSDIDDLIKLFDPDIEFPVFTPETIGGVERKDDTAIREYVIDAVFVSNSAADDKAARTREQYVDNYEAHLGVMIAYIFALSSASRSEMLGEITASPTAALQILFDTTGQKMADLIEPYLIKDNVTYDKDTFLADCSILVQGAINLFASVLAMFASDSQKADLTRLIDMHYPESTYVLLRNAHMKN